MTIYVVFYINGSVIGVADYPEKAIDIYLSVYNFKDEYAYNLATSDQLDYLMEQNKINTFILNESYYL